jgi:hypothetical protein
MRSIFHKTGFSAARLSAAFLVGAVALGISTASQAGRAPSEITLASPDQALAFCKAGKMLPSDIDYISGSAGLAQYGSAASCAQQVPKKTMIKTALKVEGSRVKACKLVGAEAALAFCQSGNMGTYNIDYIYGKVGRTISGPGYGCVVNFSTTGIGTALCK